MSTLTSFSEVLDAIDRLSPDDQDALIGIVERRRLAQRRAALANDVREARQEFRSGGCHPQRVADLVKEIRS
jgi:hypothetical protein